MSLVLVGAWLWSSGVADLGRLSATPPDRVRTVCSLAAGAVALLLALAVIDLGWTSRVALLFSGSLLLVGWVLASSAVVRTVSLGMGLVGAVLGAGLVRAERAWPAWLEPTVLAQWSVSEVLIVAGVLIAQVSTANLVVRLLLDAVGVPATTNEKQLRGGRVLGPMERLFLVCLGALGQVTAAAVVVAAKGLLRFPELQRVHRERADARTDDAPVGGPSDVTEYFLIGSLASWLVALGGAALVRLSG